MSLPLSMILVLVTTSLITTASQILFKQSATIVTANAAGGSNLYKLLQLLLMPSFIVALFLYATAFLIWMWLLSKNFLSVIYPIGLSLNVVVALIAARYFLNETITPLHMIGVMIIIVGIFIISR